MEGTYEVFYDRNVVGEACLRKKGLYWCFECYCKPVSGHICRIEIRTKLGWKSLGIPVPEGSGWRLNTKISARQLECDSPQFRLVRLEEDPPGRFLPVIEDQPFPELSQVRKGRFSYCDGIPGILLE